MVESALLGAIVSGIVQFIKNSMNTTKAGTLAVVAVLSFVFAFGVWLLQTYNLWTSFLAIVASASTIYAFFIQHFEDNAA